MQYHAKANLGHGALDHGWTFKCLFGSTEGLSNAAVVEELSRNVVRILSSMSLGSEATHLKLMTRMSDVRGSGVNLISGELRANDSQAILYLAFAWQWVPLQSYTWHNLQHINVLEYSAFFNYVRSIVNLPCDNGFRFVHVVVDSRVSSCINFKGHSSSVIINRVARRVLHLAAYNLYAKPLWTTSACNFVDHGSRPLAQAHWQIGYNCCG